MNRIILFLTSAVMFAFQSMSCGNEGASNSSTEYGNVGWFEPDTNRLDLTFSMTYDEKSKDDNSHSYEIIIKDGKILYTQRFSGFIEQPDIVVKKTINLETEKEISNYLESRKLTVNMSEKKNTSGIGVSTYMTLEIRQPTVSNIHINGKTSDWGGNPDGALSLSQDALDCLERGESFRSYIANLINK
jgi:hypothetical protein